MTWPPCDRRMVRDMARAIGSAFTVLTAGCPRYSLDFMARFAARLTRQETWN